MLTTGIQNLPEPLARAQAAYHDRTARLAPASADRLARRVERFALSVQFVSVEDIHSTGRRAARQGAQTEALTRYLGRTSGDGPADPDAARSRP